MMERRSRGLVLVGVLMGVVGVPGQAQALTYPGPAPCDTTLANCLAAAAEGEVVQLATNGPITESIVINDKSLTLEPAPGFTPQIGLGTEFSGANISLQTASRTVTIRGLRFPYGAVSVSTSGANPQTVSVTDCAITNSFAANSARGIYTDIRSPGTFRFERNEVISNGYPIDFRLTSGTGQVTATIASNRFRKASSGQSATGIELDLRGGFVATLNVWSNVVSDVADCNCGGATAVAVQTSDTVSATVNLVNNTIDLSGSAGIAVFPPGVGQLVVANIFNNVVTRATTSGLSLPAANPRLTVNNGNNDFFNNNPNTSFGGYAAGAGTVSVDPLFVSLVARDYRLEAASTLVNAGLASPPGGLSPLDADGNLRVAGPAVDIGAYERGSTPPSTTTTTTSVPATTTTTLPSCAVAATYASVTCRLVALGTSIQTAVPPGALADQLRALATTAGSAVTTAEQHAAAGRTKPRRKALARAFRVLGSFGKRLKTRKAKSLDATVRDALGTAAAAIRADVKSLQAE
jgi:hypothetical protein